MPLPPSRKSLPTQQVREFLDLLDEALAEKDDQGRKWADARWGCYAFYDYDGEPIYVGQTNEQLRVRIRRHLSNQRTDAVAMRILDVFEVAELEVWPLWEYEKIEASQKSTAKEHLNQIEYSAYIRAIEKSKFKAILNEKIPTQSDLLADLPTSRRFTLISEQTRAERGHPDVRIARRAETISRLAAVAHERGEVSLGLRRVLVIQAARLAHLAATRLAFAMGHDAPKPEHIHVSGLVGDVRKSDPEEETADAENKQLSLHDDEE
ncbi:MULTISPECIES: GIY-YIG nuclease family protein [Actinosynnema]|uniref:GIY-YIG nuclease family protein n=1 Tax=Actinosynnema TaxID=40566 RepID=UPI0020A5871F|nr:GIY-YIG nuclease family protein [Actinosynnema pretiosum]MCP2096762.1 GIY-YIG catalytic domain-containing protein [Actinosynnema pretiosum]